VSFGPLTVLAPDLAWWPRLAAAGVGGDADAAGHRAGLLRDLVRRGAADPAVAAADALLYGEGDAWDRAGAARGVRAALEHDVAIVTAGLAEFAASEAARSDDAPALAELAPPPTGPLAEVTAALRGGEAAAAVVDRVLRHRREVGGGPLGRVRAARWDGVRLCGVARPAAPDLARLTGLERQVEALVRNTEAFLDGAPAMHALLYGPRGSGKSTVVRGLLPRYAERGLRLVELPAEALRDLPAVVERLRDRPERFLVFVDDLAFESGDVRYHPLKSLLEGSVAERPDNVRLYATSNRRHLVQERLRERPDPLDDDVHAWDTHHERLALSDRFGLVVTFPSTDRRRYLAIVRHLAARDGVAGDELETRADRFARDGNGYSGRTAQQFVDAARSGLA
jgi:hypothetical protein